MTDRAVLLDTLLADPRRAADLSPDAANATLVGLVALTAALQARLGSSGKGPDDIRAIASSAASPGPPWGPDDLLLADEAAALLRVSPRWLYRHAKTLPFARKLSPKTLRFSRSGALRWLATKRL